MRNNHNKNRKSNQNKIQHVEVNKLPMPHKKVKYCPIIAQILNKNNKKLKNPIILCFVEFLNFREKLLLRTVCKHWNEAVIVTMPFLKNKENFINCIMNNSNHNNYNNIFNNTLTNNSSNRNSILASYKKTNRKSLSKNSNLHNNIHEENLFNNSDRKFSKKNVLVKLINSKNFNTIKNKVSLGDMTKSRFLSKES